MLDRIKALIVSKLTGSFLRQGLAALSGALVAAGIIEVPLSPEYIDTTIQIVIGGLGLLFSIGLSLLEKWFTQKYIVRLEGELAHTEYQLGMYRTKP